ncbi:MAG: hypothetical protein ACOC6Q_00695 [Patescibacteria group bacterium]
MKLIRKALFVFALGIFLLHFLIVFDQLILSKYLRHKYSGDMSFLPIAESNEEETPWKTYIHPTFYVEGLLCSLKPGYRYTKFDLYSGYRCVHAKPVSLISTIPSKTQPRNPISQKLSTISSNIKTHVVSIIEIFEFLLWTPLPGIILGPIFTYLARKINKPTIKWFTIGSLMIFTGMELLQLLQSDLLFLIDTFRF